MNNIIKTKWVSWLLLVIVVTWLVSKFFVQTPWWSYISVFFAFMFAFCHLAALYLDKVNKAASRRLDLIALVLGLLFVVAVIVEAIF